MMLPGAWLEPPQVKSLPALAETEPAFRQWGK